MTFNTPAWTRIDEAIIAALVRCGAMSVDDLQREVRVRRQAFLQALTRLRTGGEIKKGTRDRLGADRRRHRVTTYTLPEDRADGGSRQPDAVVLEGEPAGGAADAAAEAEAGHDAVCLGCSEPWSGPGWCPSCAAAGWHP